MSVPSRAASPPAAQRFVYPAKALLTATRPTAASTARLHYASNGNHATGLPVRTPVATSSSISAVVRAAAAEGNTDGHAASTAASSLDASAIVGSASASFATSTRGDPAASVSVEEVKRNAQNTVCTPRQHNASSFVAGGRKGSPNGSFRGGASAVRTTNKRLAAALPTSNSENAKHPTAALKSSAAARVHHPAASALLQHIEPPKGGNAKTPHQWCLASPHLHPLAKAFALRAAGGAPSMYVSSEYVLAVDNSRAFPVATDGEGFGDVSDRPSRVVSSLFPWLIPRPQQGTCAPPQAITDFSIFVTQLALEPWRAVASPSTCGPNMFGVGRATAAAAEAAAATAAAVRPVTASLQHQLRRARADAVASMAEAFGSISHSHASTGEPLPRPQQLRRTVLTAVAGMTAAGGAHPRALIPAVRALVADVLGATLEHAVAVRALALGLEALSMLSPRGALPAFSVEIRKEITMLGAGAGAGLSPKPQRSCSLRVATVAAPFWLGNWWDTPLPALVVAALQLRVDCDDGSNGGARADTVKGDGNGNSGGGKGAVGSAESLETIVGRRCARFVRNTLPKIRSNRRDGGDGVQFSARCWDQPSGFEPAEDGVNARNANAGGTSAEPPLPPPSDAAKAFVREQWATVRVALLQLFQPLRQASLPSSSVDQAPEPSAEESLSRLVRSLVASVLAHELRFVKGDDAVALSSLHRPVEAVEGGYHRLHDAPSLAHSLQPATLADWEGFRALTELLAAIAPPPPVAEGAGSKGAAVTDADMATLLGVLRTGYVLRGRAEGGSNRPAPIYSSEDRSAATNNVPFDGSSAAAFAAFSSSVEMVVCDTGVKPLHGRLLPARRLCVLPTELGTSAAALVEGALARRLAAVRVYPVGGSILGDGSVDDVDLNGANPKNFNPLSPTPESSACCWQEEVVLINVTGCAAPDSGDSICIRCDAEGVGVGCGADTSEVTRKETSAKEGRNVLVDEDDDAPFEVRYRLNGDALAGADVHKLGPAATTEDLLAPNPLLSGSIYNHHRGVAGHHEGAPVKGRIGDAVAITERAPAAFAPTMSPQMVFANVCYDRALAAAAASFGGGLFDVQNAAEAQFEAFVPTHVTAVSDDAAAAGGGAAHSTAAIRALSTRLGLLCCQRREHHKKGQKMAGAGAEAGVGGATAVQHAFAPQPTPYAAFGAPAAFTLISLDSSASAPSVPSPLLSWPEGLSRDQLAAAAGTAVPHHRHHRSGEVSHQTSLHLADHSRIGLDIQNTSSKNVVPSAAGGEALRRLGAALAGAASTMTASAFRALQQRSIADVAFADEFLGAAVRRFFEQVETVVGPFAEALAVRGEDAADGNDGRPLAAVGAPHCAYCRGNGMGVNQMGLGVCDEEISSRECDCIIVYRTVKCFFHLVPPLPPVLLTGRGGGDNVSDSPGGLGLSSPAFAASAFFIGVASSLAARVLGQCRLLPQCSEETQQRRSEQSGQVANRSVDDGNMGVGVASSLAARVLGQCRLLPQCSEETQQRRSKEISRAVTKGVAVGNMRGGVSTEGPQASARSAHKEVAPPPAASSSLLFMDVSEISAKYSLGLPQLLASARCLDDVLSVPLAAFAHAALPLIVAAARPSPLFAEDEDKVGLDREEEGDANGGSNSVEAMGASGNARTTSLISSASPPAALRRQWRVQYLRSAKFLRFLEKQRRAAEWEALQQRRSGGGGSGLPLISSDMLSDSDLVRHICASALGLPRGAYAVGPMKCGGEGSPNRRGIATALGGVVDDENVSDVVFLAPAAIEALKSLAAMPKAVAEVEEACRRQRDEEEERRCGAVKTPAMRQRSATRQRRDRPWSPTASTHEQASSHSASPTLSHSSSGVASSVVADARPQLTRQKRRPLSSASSFAFSVVSSEADHRSVSAVALRQSAEARNSGLFLGTKGKRVFGSSYSDACGHSVPASSSSAPPRAEPPRTLSRGSFARSGSTPGAVDGSINGGGDASYAARVRAVAAERRQRVIDERRARAERRAAGSSTDAAVVSEMGSSVLRRERGSPLSRRERSLPRAHEGGVGSESFSQRSASLPSGGGAEPPYPSPPSSSDDGDEPGWHDNNDDAHSHDGAYSRDSAPSQRGLASVAESVRAQSEASASHHPMPSTPSTPLIDCAPNVTTSSCDVDGLRGGADEAVGCGVAASDLQSMSGPLLSSSVERRLPTSALAAFYMAVEGGREERVENVGNETCADDRTALRSTAADSRKGASSSSSSLVPPWRRPQSLQSMVRLNSGVARRIDLRRQERAETEALAAVAEVATAVAMQQPRQGSGPIHLVRQTVAGLIAADNRRTGVRASADAASPRAAIDLGTSPLRRSGAIGHHGGDRPAAVVVKVAEGRGLSPSVARAGIHTVTPHRTRGSGGGCAECGVPAHFRNRHDHVTTPSQRRRKDSFAAAERHTASSVPLSHAASTHLLDLSGAASPRRLLSVDDFHSLIDAELYAPQEAPSASMGGRASGVPSSSAALSLSSSVPYGVTTQPAALPRPARFTDSPMRRPVFSL